MPNEIHACIQHLLADNFLCQFYCPVNEFGFTLTCLMPVGKVKHDNKLLKLLWKKYDIRYLFSLLIFARY